jgi:hypothetical protein
MDFDRVQEESDLRKRCSDYDSQKRKNYESQRYLYQHMSQISLPGRRSSDSEEYTQKPYLLMMEYYVYIGLSSNSL